MLRRVDAQSKVDPAAVVGPAELGDYLGITAVAIRALSAKGIVVRCGHGRYDLKASVRAYARYLRDIATGRGDASVSTSAVAERGRLAKAKADAQEMANAAARGELVKASEVEREWSAVLRQVRARMLAVPSRAASRLPHLSNHDVSELDAEIRAVLSGVATEN